MIENTRILLIDNDPVSRRDLAVILEFLGEQVLPADDADWLTVLQQLQQDTDNVSLVIIGQYPHSGLRCLIQAIYEQDNGLPIILLGTQGSGQFADLTFEKNITAELSFPLSYQPLLDALHQARLFREHFNRLQDLGNIKDYNMFRSLVGNSARIQSVRRMMGQVADKEVSILITGESGTGKEVVARNLHLNSPRANKPFIPINCGAIPRELLESELFGHEKGAFTGAISTREGRFELADGGTLFLDEIGDMPLNMQVKLLRVLQERSFERVGGVKTITADVRIFAATHRDLEAMIAAGEFRQDLYYRINVFPIEMPPLRERTDDIPLLLNELISTMEVEKRGSVRFNSGAINALKRYAWPGNVRELANLIERMAILHPNGIIGEKDLPPRILESTYTSLDPGQGPAFGRPAEITSEVEVESLATLPLDGLDLKEYLAKLEKDLIEQALADSDGVVARAAGRLHIRRTTLVEKIRKYNLVKDSEDSGDTEAAEISEEPSSEEIKKRLASG